MLVEKLNKFKTNTRILFAKQPALKYSQCLLRLTPFRGKDKREFMHNQQIHANGFKMLHAVEDFCDRHLPIVSYFVDTSMQRIDELFYLLKQLGKQ